MRIAQVMGSAALGGAEAFFERLVPALARAGESVLAVTRRDAGRTARLRDAGIEPVELPFGHRFDFVTARRLAATLDSFAPDVVMSWMNRASGYACQARRRPGVRWCLVGRMGGYYDLKHYRACDHIVGNTRDLRDWIVREGWPTERAHHLPNFAQDFAGIAPVVLPGRTKLLALGRLHRNKALDVLLRAMPLLPGAHLSIAGQGPEQAALQRLAGELGVAERVAFLGWREDTGALLAACDLLVCPSRHEPLGNVVLEAWSASRPVVAAAAQGPSELIADGVTGLLVPLEDHAALAAAMAELLADPARAAALAAAGRAEFERAHAEGPVLRRWQEFLHAVAPAGAIA